MKKISGWLLLMMLSAALPLSANEYTTQMKRDIVRSTTNLVSSPAEILVTVQKYHREHPAPPVIREMAGFVDGLFRFVTRFGSGAWDAQAAFIPGDQEGIPPSPETLA